MQRVMQARLPSLVCALMAIAVAVLASGCSDQRPAAPAAASAGFDAGVAYPSSAAYDARSQMLWVGSYADGSIQRVSASGAAQDGRLDALPLGDRQHVFRVRLDAERDRIWVLASNGLHLYDARNLRLTHRISIDELSQHSKEHCLPDLGIDAEGNALVSSAMQPRLVRVDAKTLGVTSHTLELDADHGKDFGFSALAFGADGASLYAASATAGTLWKIDVAKGTGEKVTLEYPTWGACAMHVATIGTLGTQDSKVVLYVAGGFREGVQRIDLSQHALPHSVTRVKMTGPVSVPTDLVAVGSKLFIVSSRLSDHPDFDGEGQPGLSFTIVQSH